MNPFLDEAPGQQQFFGKYKGFVRDNRDPEKRSRVRCYCPQVMGGDDAEGKWLDWAEPNWPWLGGINAGDLGPPLTGMEQIEDVGREFYGVWLEFEGGNPDFPIWTGTFTIAPAAADGHPLGTSGGESVVGGGIIQASPTDGSEVGPLNPPTSLKTGREIRLRAQKGRDIIIMVDGGGFVVVGASGVHAVGVQVTINGKPFYPSITEIGGV